MNEGQPVEASVADLASPSALPLEDDRPRIYRYSHLIRTLDPALPSNRAVLVLAPLAAAIAFAWSLIRGEPFGMACHAGVVAALAVFGTWALAREILPDDHAAAFVSLALGFLAALSFLSPGLFLLFSTLLLVRIVNRSTGLMPRTSDSVLVGLLVIASIYATARPWFGAVAALAFFFDGILKRPVKKQWLFALVCLGAMVVYMVDHDVAWWRVVRFDSLLDWLAVLAMLLLAVGMFTLKKVHARGDVGNARLDVDRVKAGMAVGILATLQGLDARSESILLVSTIAGLGLGITFRRAFRNPTKGLGGT